MQMPEYTSGAMQYYRICQDDKTDYPEEYLEDSGMGYIWYRELSVYDRTKYEFDQGGKEVTMKIRIPMYKEIDSRCVCIIDGKQHQVYNATHVTDKNGFPETELTLIRPEKEMKIHDKAGTE